MRGGAGRQEVRHLSPGFLIRVDAVFLDHLSQDIRGTNSSAVWRYLIAYKNLLRSIENIGIAVVYGIR